MEIALEIFQQTLSFDYPPLPDKELAHGAEKFCYNLIKGNGQISNR
ncbi:hypothetical protein NDI37_15555 [Funiculus sociatus GB2-A5]|uniref:Uncharacterized protein n=1 Tax=Funiculus sociatus GB2-A5 TaxID=2933946 RepID=A0ABV0JQX9_9CYAN|nr:MULTISPECIES: hypothetical protein [unclassified Trichocoleus]MBD1905294.1 hypothetical protein [Trichocoleus sp. FACHB-832]MBD2062696.1 hypothetical protein [Trichocoleus sp. FACHB-6]